MSFYENLIANIFTLQITLISIYYHNLKTINIYYIILSLNNLAKHSKHKNSDQAIKFDFIWVVYY